MDMIRELDAATSLEALTALVGGEAWGERLRALARGEDTDAEIAALRAAVDRARARLSPEHASPELQALKEAVYAADAGDEAALRPTLARIAELRAALPTRDHARLFGRLDAQISREFAWLNGGTGYSNRARRASSLFTDFAGQTHIAAAETDRHGNALGTGYDLGRDGAFDGHTVHVLQLCCIDFSKPTAAFGRKGFQVSRRTSAGSPDELARWLAEARQLWLISDGNRHLSADHVEVIADYWRRGGALYLWGDNEPLYADTNAVTAALFGPDLAMEGNLHGDQVVSERSEHGKVGFLPHLVTTGLVHLYEGITIASLQEEAARRFGFAPLLYGSAGNLVTVVREPDAAGGAVMIDTGFTRLYYKWDDAGSARYVCNAACFLAAASAADAVEAEAAAEVEEEQLPFDPAGAYAGTCDLSGKASDSWVVLSVTARGDALRNTSDLVLNDPLLAGRDNCVFSDALYSEGMGQWLLNLEPERRRDPFTKEPVVACLPLVDLSHPRNLRAFTEILCVVLMDGKILPSAARQVFFAVVDEMLERPLLRHRGAWEYLYRQGLSHFRTTRDFGSIGEKVPLLEAMASLFSPATEANVQLRRSFESVGVIGRTLLREGRSAPGVVRRIARRALVHVLVRGALAAEKAAPGSVPLALHRQLYDNFHGIPRLGGGRLATRRPGFVRDVSLAEARLVAALGGAAGEGGLLSVEEQTAALYALLPYDLRQFSAEALVSRMAADSPLFRRIFDSDDTCPAAELDVVGALNARFAAYAEGVDLDDPHLRQSAPFATTWGPSVFFCVCGRAFGDPEAELTQESLEALRAERVAHFRAVYRVRSPDARSWYPQEGSLHNNLHRAVQRVVGERFPGALALEEAMVPAVAEHLLRDGKGFLCDPLLEGKIRAALQSYLALRAAGQAHPQGLMTLEVKARHEQALWLAAASVAR